MKMLRKLLIIFFLLAFCANAWATTYEWEHQSKYMVSGSYGWISSYDIGFYNDTLMVDVDIYLTGYTPADTLTSKTHKQPADVPEPACFMLLGMGMVGVNLIQYKKENCQYGT